MSQKLVTKKNRKVRRLKELYPEVNVKIFYQKDFRRLLARFGVPSESVEHAARWGSRGDRGGNEVWTRGFRTRQTESCWTPSPCGYGCRSWARRSPMTYRGQDLRLVTVLKGGLYFLSDLARAIDLPLTMDFMAVSPYATGMGGVVRVTKDLSDDIAGANVLLVEDVVDTGLTVNYVLSLLGPTTRRGWKCVRSSTSPPVASPRFPSRTADSRCPTGFLSATDSILRVATVTFPASRVCAMRRCSREPAVCVGACDSVAVFAAGTAGYMLIEGWGVFDSLYMTTITVGTVGFGEVHPLSANGRLFTIVSHHGRSRGVGLRVRAACRVLLRGTHPGDSGGTAHGQAT